MEAREASEPLAWIVDRLELAAGLAEEVIHGGREDRPQEIVFVLEVEVDGAIGDAGGACDLRDARVEVTGACKDSGRRLEDRVELLGPRVTFIYCSELRY